MTRGKIYKSIYILIIILISIALILPTIGEKKMELNLKDDVTTEDINKIKNRFSSDSYTLEIKDKKIIVKSYKLTDATMNELSRFDGVKNAKLLKHIVEKILLAKKINLGLDLQGGMHLVLKADFAKIRESLKRELTEKDKYEITQQALELLRSRVDKFGVSEPSIRPRGNEAIEIQLPGIKDPKRVKDIIGKTGRLEYRFVDEKFTTDAINWINNNYKEKALPDDIRKFLQDISKEIKLPSNLELVYKFERKKDSRVLNAVNPMALLRKPELTGTDIKEAAVDRDEYGRIIVRFKTTAEGAAKLAKATSDENKGKRLAIVLDDKVRNSPSINETIASGSGNISGGFSYEEAQTLSRIIKEGALPVSLQFIEERTVGPSLGQDSIESGVKAIIIGLIGVMIFMLFYYKLAGLIANFGLILNMIFMMAILSLLGFTLTLPGIAAFILTVGMAVDANVIIYERIKEEIKNGKSVRMSIISGFDKAFWTIVDANLTTIIAAFILSQFGTGPIKGFAVTLFIGILSSMFVALYITRFIYELISLNKKIKKLSI